MTSGTWGCGKIVAVGSGGSAVRATVATGAVADAALAAVTIVGLGLVTLAKGVTVGVDGAPQPAKALAGTAQIIAIRRNQLISYPR